MPDGVRRQNMDWKLRLIQAKDFLRASPTGEVDLELAEQLLLDLARENAAPRQYDVLIDDRGADVSLSFFDMTELVRVMIENRDSFRSKLAILTLPGQRFDRAKFMELYAGNRGFSVAAFEQFEEALNWLALEGDEAELASAE
jgi:hypothetical protein